MLVGDVHWLCPLMSLSMALVSKIGYAHEAHRPKSRTNLCKASLAHQTY